jgi:hypothetical protein
MLINSPNISGSLTVTGNATISGSLNVAGGISAAITGSATSASYVEYSNVANKPTLVSGSEQITYSGLSGIPSGIVSSSTQITGYNIFATTGSNQFNGSQAITGSLTVTGQVVAQTLNVQQVTSSIVFSSGSNIFGNSLSNTQQLTGSVSVTGSMTLNGASTFSSNVGINGSPGTSFPLEAYINSSTTYSSTSRGNVFRVYNSNTDANIFAGIELGGAGSANDGLAGLNAIVTGNGSAALTFYTRDSNTFAEKIRITSGGNVGIGTDNPGQRLSVFQDTNGDARLSLINPNTGASARTFLYVATTGNRYVGMLAYGANATGTTAGLSNASLGIIEAGADASNFLINSTNPIVFGVNGSERMRITSDGNLNVTGTVAMSSPFIFRNKIINGAMTIDQRNGGAAITTDGGYPVDRFVIYTGGSANLTNQRSTTVPTGFRNSLSVTVGTGVNTSSGDYVTIRHGIEGLNIYDLAWGTASAKSITLSFWVRSSLTGNFGVALRNNANNYGYVASYNIPSANTWTYITTTIPGPTSGTWNTDNTLGIRVIWDLGVGTSYSIAAGAWTSQSEILGLTGGVKLKETTGATFYITGIQFEAGNIATPFEYRPTSIEELLCKRYYEKEVFTGGTYFVPQIAGTQTYATISYKAEKRTDPQVALPQVSTASDTSNRNPVSNGVHRGSWYGTLGGNLTNNVNSFTFTAECEL